MKRREFITLIGGAAVLRPRAASAQQADRMQRIGVLMGYAESDSVQALELAAGVVNITLLGLNIRDGLKMKGRFRRQPLKPALGQCQD